MERGEAVTQSESARSAARPVTLWASGSGDGCRGDTGGNAGGETGVRSVGRRGGWQTDGQSRRLTGTGSSKTGGWRRSRAHGVRRPWHGPAPRSNPNFLRCRPGQGRHHYPCHVGPPSDTGVMTGVGCPSKPTRCSAKRTPVRVVLFPPHPLIPNSTPTQVRLSPHAATVPPFTSPATSAPPPQCAPTQASQTRQ